MRLYPYLSEVDVDVKYELVTSFCRLVYGSHIWYLMYIPTSFCGANVEENGLSLLYETSAHGKLKPLIHLDLPPGQRALGEGL